MDKEVVGAVVETAPGAPEAVPQAPVAVVPAVEPKPELTAVELATEILNDPKLSQADYREARNNPEFLKKLVESRLAEKTAATEPKPAEPKPAVVPPEPPEVKRRGGYQRKIDKLTARVLELQDELAQSRPAAPPPAVEAVPTVITEKPAKEPVVENFDTYEDYVSALTAYHATQIVQRALDAEKQKNLEWAKKRRAELQDQEVEQATLARNRAWAENVAKGRTTHADFDEVVFDSELPLSEPMEDAVFDSEVGAELAYYLGTHPEECKRISTLRPVAAIRELGRIEAKLVKEPEPKPAASEPLTKPPVSNAPAPPRTSVASGPGTKVVKGYAYYEKAPLAEYRDARRSGELR